MSNAEIMPNKDSNEKESVEKQVERLFRVPFKRLKLVKRKNA